MILMDVKLDNLYAFQNFSLNMSYPKKIVNSTIEGEFLEDYPNFRFKKVIILMGANASGKTSLGKAMLDIFSFIDKKEFGRIVERICDKTRPATFSVDFVNNNLLYRVEALFDATSVYRSENIHVCVQKSEIKTGDSYETCASRFKHVELGGKRDYILELEEIEEEDWMFEFTLSPERNKQYSVSSSNKYLEVLKNTLRTLDPQIIDVTRVEESQDSYIIKYNNMSIMLHDGELIDKYNILSSGTKEGIGVANIFAAVKSGEFSFFYCDEKFSHIHSEAEKAFLSALIECLGYNRQLFFTTHNTDILDMNLPKHSFAFLRRNADDDSVINCVYASEYLKKNTDSLRNAVENDLFATMPSVDKIYALADL